MADRDLNFNVNANTRGVSGGMINVRKEIRETSRMLDSAKTSADRFSESMEDIAKKRDLGLLSEEEAGVLTRQAQARRFQESGAGQLLSQIPGVGRFIPRAAGPIALLTTAITGLTTVIRGLTDIHKSQLDAGQRAGAMAMPENVRLLSRLENNLRDEQLVSEGATAQTVQGLGRLAQERFGGDLSAAAAFLDRTVGRARGIRQIEMAQEFGVSPEAFNLPEGVTLSSMLGRVTPGETRPSDVAAARWRARLWNRSMGGLRGIGTGILRDDPIRVLEEVWNAGGDVGGPNDMIRQWRDINIQTMQEHGTGGISVGMGAS